MWRWVNHRLTKNHISNQLFPLPLSRQLLWNYDNILQFHLHNYNHIDNETQLLLPCKMQNAVSTSSLAPAAYKQPVTLLLNVSSPMLATSPSLGLIAVLRTLWFNDVAIGLDWVPFIFLTVFQTVDRQPCIWSDLAAKGLPFLPCCWAGESLGYWLQPLVLDAVIDALDAIHLVPGTVSVRNDFLDIVVSEQKWF